MARLVDKSIKSRSGMWFSHYDGIVSSPYLWKDEKSTIMDAWEGQVTTGPSYGYVLLNHE